MPTANYYGGFSHRKSPWSSNEERLVDEAIERHTLPREIVAQTRPALPHIELFPERFGYGDSASRQATIGDALATDRWLPDRRLDYSGMAGGWSGTSRPSVGDRPATGVNPF